MDSNYQYRGIVNASKQRRENLENSIRERFGDIYEFLYTEYVVNKRSTKDISKQIGCARSCASKMLKRYGIDLRGKGEANIGRTFKMSEEQKQRLRESFSKPEVKQKRSESQKEVWSKLNSEQRKMRTMPGNIARTKMALETTISSIEIKVAEQLDWYGIRYIQQKRVYDNKNNKAFYLDFYIPEYKLVIECNGDYWHNLSNRIERDEMLEQFVKSTGRKIIFIWEYEIKDEWFDIMDYIKEGI